MLVTKKYTQTSLIDLKNSEPLNDVTLADVLVIIPCFNEELNIEKTIARLLRKYPYHFLIVDDCSSDKSLELIQKNKWNHIHNEQNLGLSKSFRVGVKYALDNNYKYVIQYDGDGQHNAEDIESMIIFAKKGYDLVLTSRYYSINQIESQKVIAHSLLKFLIYIRTWQVITDPTCGLRLYNWTAMQNYMDNKRLEVEPSGICYLIAKKKLKMKELPTVVFNRENGESLFGSKKHIIKYMFKQTLGIIFLEFLHSPKNKHKKRG